MNAKHALRKRSESRITCKTQVMANYQHRLVARSGAQAKLHQASNNQIGRLYPAFIVPPLVLFSIRRRSTGDRWWCPRYVSASIVDPLTTSKPKTLAEPRPVAMSLSYNMYNIGMRDDWSKVLKTLLFSTEIRFRPSISVRNTIQRCHFPAKTEGHGDTTSNLFHQKKKASCHEHFLQKMKGSVCSREIFSFKKWRVHAARISSA